MGFSDFMFGPQLHKQSSGLGNTMDMAFGPENMGRGETMFAPHRALAEANMRRQLGQNLGSLQQNPNLSEAAREQFRQRATGQFQQGMGQAGLQFAGLESQFDMDLWGRENELAMGRAGLEEQVRASKFQNQGGGFMDWLGGAASGFLGGIAGGAGAAWGQSKFGTDG